MSSSIGSLSVSSFVCSAPTYQIDFNKLAKDLFGKSTSYIRDKVNQISYDPQNIYEPFVQLLNAFVTCPGVTRSEIRDQLPDLLDQLDFKEIMFYALNNDPNAFLVISSFFSMRRLNELFNWITDSYYDEWNTIIIKLLLHISNNIAQANLRKNDYRTIWDGLSEIDRIILLQEMMNIDPANLCKIFVDWPEGQPKNELVDSIKINHMKPVITEFWPSFLSSLLNNKNIDDPEVCRNLCIFLCRESFFGMFKDNISLFDKSVQIALLNAMIPLHRSQVFQKNIYLPKSLKFWLEGLVKLRKTEEEKVATISELVNLFQKNQLDAFILEFSNDGSEIISYILWAMDDQSFDDFIFQGDGTTHTMLFRKMIVNSSNAPHLLSLCEKLPGRHMQLYFMMDIVLRDSQTTLSEFCKSFSQIKYDEDYLARYRRSLEQVPPVLMAICTQNKEFVTWLGYELAYLNMEQLKAISSMIPHSYLEEVFRALSNIWPAHNFWLLIKNLPVSIKQDYLTKFMWFKHKQLMFSLSQYLEKKDYFISSYKKFKALESQYHYDEAKERFNGLKTDASLLEGHVNSTLDADVSFLTTKLKRNQQKNPGFFLRGPENLFANFLKIIDTFHLERKSFRDKQTGIFADLDVIGNKYLENEVVIEKASSTDIWWYFTDAYCKSLGLTDLSDLSKIGVRSEEDLSLLGVKEENQLQLEKIRSMIIEMTPKDEKDKQKKDRNFVADKLKDFLSKTLTNDDVKITAARISNKVPSTPENIKIIDELSNKIAQIRNTLQFKLPEISRDLSPLHKTNNKSLYNLLIDLKRCDARSILRAYIQQPGDLKRIWVELEKREVWTIGDLFSKKIIASSDLLCNLLDFVKFEPISKRRRFKSSSNQQK